jgi:hypothetical protein
VGSNVGVGLFRDSYCVTFFTRSKPLVSHISEKVNQPSFRESHERVEVVTNFHSLTLVASYKDKNVYKALGSTRSRS